MITADQLLCHAFGDYVIQSDWMANNKTKRSLVALAHVVTYAVPFLLLRPSMAALAVIVSTHFIIDRWRLARIVCYWKNQVLGDEEFQPWSECSGTGYHKDRPPCMHVLINGLALRHLP